MKLIDIERFTFAIAAQVHPDTIAELVFIQVPHNGGKAGTEFHPESVRIAVVCETSAAIVDAVFIKHSFRNVRKSELPELAIVNTVHLRFCPAVAVTGQADAGGAGGKYRKGCVIRRVVASQMQVGVKHTPGIKSLKVHHMQTFYPFLVYEK